jgi:hypothetical protein
MALDVDKLIADQQAARAKADAQKAIADKAAAALKASKKANKETQLKIENQLNYANTLSQTIADMEGKLTAYATSIGRGDKLSTGDQKEFDKLLVDYKNADKTYKKTITDVNTILAKAPSPTKVEVKNGKVQVAPTAEEVAVTGTKTEDKTAQTQKPEDFAGLLKTAPEFIRKMSGADRKLLATRLNQAFGSKIPVVDVYTDALTAGYQNAISGALGRYNQFKDVFSVDQYLAEKAQETAAISAASGTGTGGPSLTQYPIISSSTDAKALFNKVFQSELGRDATAAEIKTLFPALRSAQAANPETTKSTVINGKKVLERTSGLNTEQWVIDQLNKDTKLKSELDKYNLQSPDLNKRLAEKKIYDDALAKAGNDPDKIQAINDTTTYGRGVKEFENGIAQIAFEQGATNTPEEITAIAKALYDKGIPPSGSTFRTEVNTALKFGADKIGKYRGKAGETFADLATTAAANGIDLQKAFGTQLPNWIASVEKGESIDTFKRLIRDTAKIGMPEKIAKLIDQGIDLEAIYSPYKSLMANTLEINPKTITMNDPTLRSAITQDAEVPLYQFERQLRKDDRWQYTNQANKEVGDATQQILKDFGFMG